MRQLAGYRWSLGAKLWLLALLGLGWSNSGARGGETPAVPASQPTAVVSLQYQEVTYPLGSTALSVVARSLVFPQEPELSAGSVHRGQFTVHALGPPPMGFIWDAEAKRLVLDLNRNGDLTDDPDGVFSARESSVGGRFQVFPEVRLNCPTARGSYPVLLDLTLTSYGAVRVSAALRSFFAGQVTLQDREWQIGIVDRLLSGPGTFEGTAFLLRPWEEHEASFRVGTGATDAIPFTPQLFFDGRAYQMQGEYELEAAPPVCRVQLTEQTVALGELEIAGQFVRRLVLRDGPWTAVLDEPSGAVPVPAGNYGSFLIQLQQAEALALPQVWPADRGIQRPTVVGEGRPTVLAAGGPLTNLTQVNRRRQHVVFHYQLVGAAGDVYRLVEQGQREPPGFTVYRGGQPIASGSFEFG
jgi:hypothetical protein